MPADLSALGRLPPCVLVFYAQQFAFRAVPLHRRYLHGAKLEAGARAAAGAGSAGRALAFRCVLVLSVELGPDLQELGTMGFATCCRTLRGPLGCGCCDGHRNERAPEGPHGCGGERSRSTDVLLGRGR